MNGNGTLMIDGVRQVSCNDGYLGESAGSVGSAIVKQAGSQWTLTGRLALGGYAPSSGGGGNGGTGTLAIQPGGEVDVAHDTVLFPNGLLSLEGGTFATTEFDDSGGQFSWNSGTLHIDHWHGHLTTPAGGILAPGRSAGITVIDDGYTQLSGGALAIDIGGYSIGTEQDYVDVSTTALLAGELQLSLLPGFTPSASDTFTILNAPNGIAGVFSNVATGQRLATVDGKGSFLVNYGATTRV